MTALNIIQILLSILLTVVILVQVRGQGTGLFGSAEGSFRTRRGIERTPLPVHHRTGRSVHPRLHRERKPQDTKPAWDFLRWPPPVARRPPVVTLTTDFGTADGYVAAMKGVMLGIEPRLTLVDVSHEVPPQDVAHGAFVLAEATRHFHAGAVHLAVVDPRRRRQPQAAACGHPRRPLRRPPTTDCSPASWPATARLTTLTRRSCLRLPPPLPADCRAFELVNPRYRLLDVSHTFHGRDVFAPAAAHLSSGVPPKQFGPPVAEVVWLNLPPPAASGGVIEGRVIHVDRFGNLITNIALTDETGRAVVVDLGSLRIQGLGRSYDEADGELAIVGSHGTLEIAVRDGNAAPPVRPGCRRVRARSNLTQRAIIGREPKGLCLTAEAGARINGITRTYRVLQRHRP